MFDVRFFGKSPVPGRPNFSQLPLSQGCPAPRGPVDSADSRPGIGRQGGGIEGRILDVMAHQPHGIFAPRLGFQKRTLHGFS